MKHLACLSSFILCICFWAQGQTPCRDTLVRCHDSICDGQEYSFNGRILTHTGYYYDTLPRVGTQCDSVIIFHLAVLDKIYAHPNKITYCGIREGYQLLGITQQFYHRWSSSPHDNTLEGQEHLVDPFVTPSQPTTYTLYADYRESPPQCPSSGTITLNPVQGVRGSLRVEPQVITYDNPEITLTDLSVGNHIAHYEGWAGRNWYINGVRHPSGNQSVTIPAYPWWGDTVSIMLEAYTPTCIDTVIRRIPFQRISLIFPNVFCPGKGERLVPQLQGILSYELWIYNRYGALVYHSADASQPWDGSCHGAPCPQGAYVYTCRYTTIDTPKGINTHTGTITLVR